MLTVKLNRTKSFIVIAVVYILASVVGIAVYALLPLDMWLRLLIADITATVFVFIFSLIFKNASVYDPYWSVQPVVILASLFVSGPITLTKILALIPVLIWGVRLTANWAYTFMGIHHQDWRYTMLSERAGAFYPIINFLGIHLVPTLVVYLATLPFALVMTSLTPFSPLCLIGFCLSIAAVVLQTVADLQMHRYRKNRKTPFVETGLWRYSRHPNYLAEILFWWGVAIFTVASLGFSWYYVAGAIANSCLFLFVSIPLADGRQAKKAGFEEYKKRTRMLLPIRK